MKHDEKGTQRGLCAFAGAEKLCETLDKAGVPRDPKWRTLIIYMRGLEYFDFLSTSQKAAIQELVLNTLREKDFTDQKFQEVARKQEEILNTPCTKRLEVALKETLQMVSEFQELMTKRRGDVEHLGTKTVDTIQNGGDPDAIIATLKVAFHKIVSEMKKDTDNLTHMSMTDALTGLNNRRAFNEHLDEVVDRALSLNKPLTLLMLDIDHFKLFNDRFGHRIGDQALATVAKLIKEYAEVNPLEEGAYFSARYGGEEFVVVLFGVGEAQAMEVGEAIRQSVEQYNFILRGASGEVVKRGIHITVSIGVGSLKPEWRGAFAENLIDVADNALYAAKSAGRNRVVGHSQLPLLAEAEKKAEKPAA